MKLYLVRLGDVAEIERNGIPPSAIREGTSYVGLEHIDGSGAIEESTVAEGELASAKFRFSSKHVLYGKLRPYLRKIARPSFSGICSTDIIPIKPGPQVDRNYLFHVLRQDTLVAKATSLATGINLPRISPKILETFEIAIPPMGEQQRIAAILDQADDLRRKRRHVLDRLGSVAQAIFEEMFDAGRATRMEPLGVHLSFITSGGRNWAKFYAPTGSRFLRSLDVQMNSIGSEDIVFVGPPENAEARRTKVEFGDVLVTITGSRIGRVAAVPRGLAGSYVSQHVAILRPKASILPRFLSFYLSLEGGGQRQIAKAQYGQTKPGLNFEQIRSFRVPVPSIRLQEQFVARTEDIDALTTVQQAHLARTVFGPGFAVIVDAGGGDVGVAEPLLDLGDIGLMIKDVMLD